MKNNLYFCPGKHYLMWTWFSMNWEILKIQEPYLLEEMPYIIWEILNIPYWITTEPRKMQKSRWDTLVLLIKKLYITDSLGMNTKIRNFEHSKHWMPEHHILAQNRTSNMSNITKNWTVCEHQTVCSKTSLVT